MDDSSQKTLAFLKTKFQEYYAQEIRALPDRFSRREFAFVLFAGKGMMRHISFTKKADVYQYLKERGPQHAYYSSAYYKLPDAPTMQEKEWMGAELIFDLDSDHLPNAEKMTYAESLAVVKQEFKKLVEEFLLDDFGFQKKYLELYFSGGRGYHCHVKDPNIFDLDSNERREIVDYITARDLQDSIIFHEQATGRRRYGSQYYASGKSLMMPRPDQIGWKGRISREIIAIINEIIESNDPIAKLQDYGVKRNEAEKLVKELSEERVQRIRSGMLDQSKTIRKFFLNRALRKTAVALSAGETDEPVTCDVKRLIRLPFSLHGKTGFKVVPIALQKLDHFEPLTDALAFHDEPTEVLLHNPYSISLKDIQYTLEKGKQTVPLYVAVFLCGRRQAVMV